MGYLDRYHWEHGEDHPAWSNVGLSNLPPVDGVSATGALTGGFSKRIEFDSNDNFQARSQGVYTRSAVGTAILMGFALQIDDLTLFDHLSFYFEVEGSSGANGVGISIQPNGAVQVRAGNNIAQNFATGTLLGSSSAGAVVEGVKNYIVMRIVVDDTNGEAKVAVNNATVLDLSTVDTWNRSGNPETGWGCGAYLSSAASGVNDEPVIIDDHVLADDMADVFKPQLHEALTPNGVTADNDGTVGGGAADAAEATDEIPATGTDFFTLDAVDDRQGLTFTDRTHTGTVTGVQAFGSVGDSAAGSEEVEAELSDGTSSTTGPTLAISTSFDSQELTGLLNTKPSGGDWDDTTVNAIELTLDRTT